MAEQGTFAESPGEKESLCPMVEETGKFGREQGNCQYMQRKKNRKAEAQDELSPSTMVKENKKMFL